MVCSTLLSYAMSVLVGVKRQFLYKKKQFMPSENLIVSPLPPLIISSAIKFHIKVPNVLSSSWVNKLLRLLLLWIYCENREEWYINHNAAAAYLLVTI